MNKQPAARNPWAFVPTLYFIEGLPYAVINIVSTLLFVDMGIPNDTMAKWTSWLMWPWIIKPLWAPLVDISSTKRRWIVALHPVMALCLAAAGFLLFSEHFFLFTLSAFLAAAFISATYDTAADGFYMLALNAHDQALYNGFRAGFYRLAMVFASGGLVYLAGKLEESTGSVPFSWMTVLLVAGGISGRVRVSRSDAPSSRSRQAVWHRKGTASIIPRCGARLFSAGQDRRSDRVHTMLPTG